MSRLLFLSSISGALVAGGCSDDACGTGGAPNDGLLASDASTQITFGSLTSSANNDCPDPSAPSGVVSLTITGSQMGGGGLLTMCLPRPDLAAEGGVALGSGLKIIDFSAEYMGCTYTLDSTRPPLGSAGATGLCDNGTNKAGYALKIDGNVSLQRACDTSTGPVALSFAGTVAVKVP